MRSLFRYILMTAVTAAFLWASFATDVVAQKKSAKPKPQPAPVTTQTDSVNLRKQYVETTEEYKASLEKLLVLYKAGIKKAEDRHDKSKGLFKDGLISKTQLEESEQALAVEQLKAKGIEHQLKSADAQIAQALLEVEGERQMAKLAPLKKGGFVKTTSFIRYAGAGNWAISQAGKLEQFFQQSFRRPLPIAVFGQGNVHNRWRLDHRNAMDVSVHPDSKEGQALISFMQSNGIPFSAFRGAIPGVATGPHIHIGRPSHRF